MQGHPTDSTPGRGGKLKPDPKDFFGGSRINEGIGESPPAQVQAED